MTGTTLKITSPNSRFLVKFKLSGCLNIPAFELKGNSEIEFIEEKDETMHSVLQK